MWSIQSIDHLLCRCELDPSLTCLKIISPRRFVDQECQLFPWNLCAELCAYKHSLRAVLRLSGIGALSAIRALADIDN